ncbi:MAG: hypothetical protein HY808_00920 [Nitrospirae bacterium]|nr:hypothetical protein [Nitrospirota bacterium]
MKRRMWIVILFLSAASVLFSVSSYAMSDRPDKSETSTEKAVVTDPQETQELAKAAIDRMIASYSKRNAWEFMESVADDFTGEKALLDRTVRKDLSLFTDIDIRYTLDNVISDSGDKVSVTITFTRSHTVVQTAGRNIASGTTELIFRKSGNSLKLYSMKPLLIFGVSGQ